VAKAKEIASKQYFAMSLKCFSFAQVTVVSHWQCGKLLLTVGVRGV
jgi:hypothetical protein